MFKRERERERERERDQINFKVNTLSEQVSVPSFSAVWNQGSWKTTTSVV